MKHERMKITSQHIIRLLAVILMMAGGFAGGNRACADGTQPQGSGTSSDPYRISSAAEWKYFESLTGPYIDNFFILTNDIVVETMFAHSGDFDFLGTFDGMGHTLTFNMGSESSPISDENCAPFCNINTATIKNLKVEGAVYVSGKYAGGIVGKSTRKSTIQNCISSLSIKSTLSGDGSHGGIIGIVNNNVTTIQNCIFNGDFQGRNTDRSAGFVGCGNAQLDPKCSIYNSIFDPSDVNYNTAGCATFSRCSINDSDKLYYKKTFGTEQGTDAQGWSDSKLYDEIKGGKGDGSWVLHCDTLYLKPFQRYVDITGWASGSSANVKSPSVEGTRSNKTVIYSYYKFGETSTLPDGAPTEKGHYTVKASVKAGTDNDSHTWPAWESTMHFCVYDPPTKVERDYDASNTSLLTDKGSIDVGTFYYRFKKDGGSYGDWSTDVPSATEQGEYTIQYYIKGNGTHNDIGSEGSPAGTITSKINIKSVVGDDLTVTFDPASYTYDGTAKLPAVTVKKGNNEVNSSEYKVAYSNNTNAGTATVTITDNKADGNYEIAQTTKTFTIEKEQLKATVTAKTLTYSGEAQELVSGSLSGTNTANCSIKYSSDGTNYTSTIPKGREVKTYTVYYKAEGDSNHKGTDAATVEVTISAKTVSNPKVVVSPSSFTYDGTEKKPDVTVYDGETEIDKSEYTVGYSNNTNAGTATVTITDADGGNYTVSGTGSFTILSEGSTYTPPTAKTGLVYNGTEQELLTAGSTTTGTMQYSSDGKTYSTDIPKGTNAKTYTVYYMVVGDGNHKDSSPVSLTVTIGEKTVSSPVITLSESSYVYDGKAKEPTVTVNDGDNVIDKSEYTVSYSDNTNVGTAKVTITDKDGGNYIVSGSTTFKIGDAGSKVTPPKVKTGLVYNGKAQELVTAGSAEGGTLEYSTDGTNYSSSVPTGTDAKTYTVYYKVTGDTNHGDIEASSLSVTISSKEMTSPKIEVSPSSYTYDGTAKTPNVTVKDKDTDTVIFSDEYTVSYSDNTNVGTATVTITDKDGGNYKVSGTATFNIQETGSTYTPPTVKTGLSYNGSEQELLTAGSTTTGEMQYSSDGKTYSTDIPKGTDAKIYTVYYKVVGDGNHKDSSPVLLTVTISEKTVSSPTIILSESSYVYDGSEKKPTVTVKDGETEISAAEYSVSYSDNVSVGTATVTLTDKDGGNYIVSGSTTFKIVDADAEFTAPAAKTGLVYNGKAQELVTAGHTKYGTLRYSSDGTNYSTSLPTGTDAKTYTVYYKVTGDSNHKDTDAATIEVTINAKTVTNPTITVSPSSFTYDGTAKTPDVTVYDGDTEIASSEYSVSYSNNTNAGTAIVTITDKDGGNYNVNGTGSFSIVSDGSTYTPPTAKTGLVYNGTEQELISEGSTTTGQMLYSSDGQTYSTNIPKGTDAKTYSIYYKVVGDDNHDSTSPVSLTVTISEKTVSSPVITLSPSSYYYDGTVKKPSVTVKDGETEISSSEYTVGYTDNKNIGTATVIISDNDGGNYRVSGTANFSIVDPEKSETPMAKSDLVYNGTAQELITSGKATEGNTMVYSLDGSNYSSKIPTGTNAKTYTVYFKEVDANNKDVTSAFTLKATISPKTISITVKVSEDGNNRPTLTITDDEGNELSPRDYIITYRNAAGKEVDFDKSDIEPGDYTVTIKLTGNYTGPSATKSIRITKPFSFVFTMESDVMSVCLPYDCSVPSGYHLYYFDRVNEKGYPVFKRILTKKMGAGKPYLLRYAGSSSSTRGSRTVDLSPSNPALVDFSTSIEIEYNDGMLFKGTFEQINSIKAHADGDYVLQADNTWIHPADEGMDVISLEPFHAYLRYEDRSTPVSVMGMVMMATTDTDEIYTTDPDHPTGLDQIEFDDDTEQWYDLQGRRLDGPQRGVNIIRKSDGCIRKVVKK